MMRQFKKMLLASAILILALIITGCCVSHEWMEATCEQPKTCVKCGKTEGEPLGHDPSDWITKREASLAEPGLRVRVCNRCQENLEEEEITLPVYKNEKFLFSGDEFVTRLQNALKILDDDIGVLDATGDSNMVSIGVYSKNRYKNECLIIFTDPKFQTIGGRTNKNLNASVVACVDAGGDKYEVDIINTAVIMACGDNIDANTAEDILHRVQSSNKAIKINDVSYTKGQYEKYDTFFVGFIQ